LAIYNHHDARGVLPTGGDTPWPSVENYIINGQPAGPDKQGMGWAYQILPYIEGGPVYGILRQSDIGKTVIPGYVCPSRRSPTQFLNASNVLNTLMDYASATPSMQRLYRTAQGELYKPEAYPTLWQSSDPWVVPYGKEWRGAIVRTNWDIHGTKTPRAARSTPPIGFQHLIDGTSTTIFVGEKRLDPARYDTGAWYDDRGWSDGWDPDTIRTTAYQPSADRDIDQAFLPYQFGSAHPSAMNLLFADGSVRTITYTIDLLTFNDMGDRRDGQVVQFSQ
jgi:prepilin-type processing-associated H-X9-DG protein